MDVQTTHDPQQCECCWEQLKKAMQQRHSSVEIIDGYLHEAIVERTEMTKIIAAKDLPTENLLTILYEKVGSPSRLKAVSNELAKRDPDEVKRTLERLGY